MRGLHLLIAATALAVSGCPSAKNNDQAPASPAADTAAEPAVSTWELVVWADPLLETPLAALQADFRAQYGGGYSMLFLERGELLSRATAGDAASPPPDVFITADTPTPTALREAGVTDEVTARTFAGDSLALVQPAGQGYASGTLFDIYKLRFEHLAVGAEETAVGYYARQALITEGGFKRVEDRLKPFARTTELLASLSGGESPLAIITKSQFVQSDGLALVLLVSERLHEDIRYQAVAARGRGADAGVLALLRFLAEDEQIQLKLAGFGLIDRQTAMVEDR